MLMHFRHLMMERFHHPRIILIEGAIMPLRLFQFRVDGFQQSECFIFIEVVRLQQGLKEVNLIRGAGLVKQVIMIGGKWHGVIFSGVDFNKV